MNLKLEQTLSVWMQIGGVPFHRGLSKDVDANICVIGAGTAGMTCAYLVLKEGRAVIVVDDGLIGGGQTERTTAHITNALDDHYTENERWHGWEGARFAAESYTAAIDCIEEMVNCEKTVCDFDRLDGYLFHSFDESPNLFEKQLQASRRAGMTQVE